ncbi:uncharacterized protein LOC132196416 [Neocloeon triangulifer]|uniref:uncharacterized protein LOC132196416 n=1 Tax=Neocloeon triangulifer TaxID=2078957 RepID=UPI00286ECF3A|nr:uncharacterized protein LOC132196416 [Neocloeon triangulifer]
MSSRLKLLMFGVIILVFNFPATQQKRGGFLNLKGKNPLIIRIASNLGRSRTQRTLIVKCCERFSCYNGSNTNSRNTVTSLATKSFTKNDDEATTALMSESEPPTETMSEGATTSSSVVAEATEPVSTDPPSEISQIPQTMPLESSTASSETPSSNSPPNNDASQSSTSGETSSLSELVTTTTAITQSTTTTFPTTTTTTTVPTTTTTTVPTTTTNPYEVLYECNSVCKKNASLYLSGRLINAEIYGYWVVSCGTLYLWGNVVLNWQENVDRCCSIGMTPIIIENDAKRQCLINLAKPPLWKYNAHYWTSGRRIMANATFQWCLSNSTFSNVSNIWQSGQPDNTNNSENCVHLNIDKTKGSVATTDKNCSNLYVFGCQGPTTPAPPCFKPQCTNFVCAKEPSYFTTLPDGVTQHLTSPSNYGFWYTTNGRTYLFSREKKSWLDAQKACCSIGMKLLSIEYQYEYANLIAAAKNLTQAQGIFWTSGTDEGCEGNFGWCAVNQLVRNQEAKWQAGEPNNANNNENCIYITLSKTGAPLWDAGCAWSENYICEARDTTKTSSNSEAMVDECGAAFNVSRDEAMLIFNSTQFSLKIKCFLKCMGENGGFMLNGKLVNEKILEMAESFAASSTILQENMAAVSICGSKKGMDECDTASLVYQCGQEKVPDLVANIINTVEVNASAESVPLPSLVHKCLTDFNCVMDPVLRADYDNNRPIPNGEIFTACGIKYLHQSIMQPYQSASSFCCTYGLKLAYFEDSTNVNCLVSSTMSSAGRAEHSWLAASRLGSGKFGWCTSSLPFTAMSGSIIDAYPDRNTSEWFLLSVRIGADLQPQNTHFSQEQLSSNCYALCRP